jgi:two-component system, chemotaxis family, response regulator Rcp1
MTVRTTIARPIELLVVDDGAADLEITLAALREAGVRANISAITDGALAVDFLKRTGEHRSAPRPDLVFLDLELPKMNGHQVLAIIKADPSLRRIPVVMLSGSCNEANIHRAYDGQIAAYIVKPMDFDSYVAAIRAVDELWFHCATLPSRP